MKARLVGDPSTETANILPAGIVREVSPIDKMSPRFELNPEAKLDDNTLKSLNLRDVGNIKDLCINWNSSRLAACCDHGEVKIFKRLNADSPAKQWEFIQTISLASECRKLKWAHSDLGNVFAILTEDSKVLVYREMQITVMTTDGVPVKKMSWEAISVIDDRNFDAFNLIKDVKFAPSHFGFAVTVIYKTGFFEVKSLQDFVIYFYLLKYQADWDQ